MTWRRASLQQVGGWGCTPFQAALLLTVTCRPARPGPADPCPKHPSMYFSFPPNRLAERAKESTLSTAMLSSGVRGSPPHTTYEFEYEVDSTRGKKRFLSAVTVAGSKLHILNASVGCGKGEAATCAPLEADLQRLRRAIASFDVDRSP